MSTRIGDYHIATYRVGSYGYQIGRRRGEIAVWHDQRLYLYRRPYKTSIPEIRSAILDAWDVHTNVRIYGRFPEYTIETGN